MCALKLIYLYINIMNLDTCLAELNKRIEGLNIDQKSIVLITKYAMEVVEATSLKGDAQKKMVLEMLKKVIQDSHRLF